MRRISFRRALAGMATPKTPLIAIVGVSGAGKSRLAVDLALEFNGEVINGDAMQMYAGLPIITNKMPPDERRGVAHHMLGCIDPLESTWRADKFVEKAVNLIDDIQRRGRLPILVGGSNYYTHSLLFRDALLAAGLEDSCTQRDPKMAILDGPTEDMLTKLNEVDPDMAARWHPNDTRKIRRSLEIWLQTGRRASELYAEQALDEAQAMRYSAIVLCPHASQEVLRERVRARVDQMKQDGLLREAIDLNLLARVRESQGQTVEKDRSIFVSIGYKELETLLDALYDGQTDPKELQALEDEAVEAVKASTWHYTRTQVRWIRNKLVESICEAHAAPDPPFVVLDTTEPLNWSDGVLEPAIQCTRQFLNGESVMLRPQIPSNISAELFPDPAGDEKIYHRRVCNECNVTTLRDEDWQRHVNSKRHRTAMKRSSSKIRRVQSSPGHEA